MDKRLKIKKLVKKFYEDFSKEFSATRIKPWNEVVYYYNLFKKNSIICDVGCGNGRHSLPLVNDNLVVGLDFSFNLIKIAHTKIKKMGKIFLPVVSDALYMPFRNNYFDAVISVATIHHIPSFYYRKKFLENCLNITKRNGIILLTAWNIMNLKRFFLCIIQYPLKFKGEILEFGDVYIGWGKKAKRYHHLFTLNEMKKLLRSFNVKILLITSFRGKFIKENYLGIILKN